MGSEMMRRGNGFFFVGTMKKLSLWLCIWFWWRRVIVRVLKITKMSFKTVLNEGKSSILHRVVKNARFDPHQARFCARFIRFLQTLRVGVLRRALLFWPLRAAFGRY